MVLKLAGRKIIGKVREKAYQGKTRRERQIKAKKRELYEYRKEHKYKIAMLDATCLREEKSFHGAFKTFKARGRHTKIVCWQKSCDINT